MDLIPNNTSGVISQYPNVNVNSPQFNVIGDSGVDNNFTPSTGKPNTSGLIKPDGIYIIGGTDIDNAIENFVQHPIERTDEPYNINITNSEVLPLRQEYENLDTIYLNSPKIDIYNQCNSEIIFASENGEIIVKNDEDNANFFENVVHKMPNGRFAVLTYTFNNNYCSYTYTYTEMNNNYDYFYGDANSVKTDKDVPYVFNDQNAQIIALTNVLDNIPVFTYDFYNPIANSYISCKYLGPIIQSSGVKKFGNNIPYYNNIISEDVAVNSYDFVTYINLVALYNNSLYTLIDDYSTNEQKIVKIYKAYDIYKEQYKTLEDNNAFVLTYDLNSSIYFSYHYNDNKLSITRYDENGNSKLLDALNFENLSSYNKIQITDDIFYYSYIADVSVNSKNDNDDRKGQTNIWFNFSYNLYDSNFNLLTYYTLNRKYGKYSEVLDKNVEYDCTYLNVIIADENHNNDNLRFRINLKNNTEQCVYLTSQEITLLNTYIIDYSTDYSSNFDFYEHDINVNERQFPILQTYLDTRHKFQNDVPSYGFRTQELNESLSIHTTYLYFNSLTGDYEQFIPDDTKLIIYNEGSFYGVISDELIRKNNYEIDGTTYYTYVNLPNNSRFNIVPVTKRITFDSSNSSFANRFIPEQNQTVNINNYVPFYLRNTIDKIPQDSFILNKHKYSYVLSYTDEEKKHIAVTPIIIQDEYWTQEYKEVEKPLIVNSETKISHSLDVERAQIVAGLQDIHMGTIHHPKVTYNNFEITYTKEIKYGYYDTNNIFNVFEGRTYDINGVTYGIINDGDRDFPLSLSKFTTVNRDRVLKECVYQEDHTEDIKVKRESSFKLVNGERLIIDQEIYNAPEYEDIITVNPNTYEYEVVRKKVSDEYLTYAYHYETVPFVTNSYVFNQNGLEISNLNTISDTLINTNDAIIETGNTLNDTIKEIDLSIKNGLNNLTTTVQANNLVSTFTTEHDKNRVLFSDIFNGLINRYETALSASTIELDGSIDTISSIISKVGGALLDANDEISEKQISSAKTNNENLIDSLKNRLINIDNSIKSLKDAIQTSNNNLSKSLSNIVSSVSESNESLTDSLTDTMSTLLKGVTDSNKSLTSSLSSTLSSVNSSNSALNNSLANVLNELSKQDDGNTLVYINAGTDGSNTAPINIGGSSSDTSLIGLPINNYASIKQIGEIKQETVLVEKTMPTPGNKVSTLTIKVPEIREKAVALSKPKDTETTQFVGTNTTMHALTAQMGLHKTVNTTRVVKDKKIYEVDNVTYEGLADIVYAMSRRIPTKQEFVIDVAKQLYINTAFDIETSYKSPSDHAKTAIHRALIMWTELENTKFVKPSIQDNTLAYTLIENYKH